MSRLHLFTLIRRASLYVGYDLVGVCELMREGDEITWLRLKDLILKQEV